MIDYSLHGETTERLRFRKVVEEDFEDWLTFFRDPTSNQFLFLPHEHNPEAQCKMWFARVAEREATGTGAVNALESIETGEVVGQCGLLIQEVDGNKELEIGYWMKPNYRGKGFAKEAAIRCKEYAFEHELANSIISIVHVDNIASSKVAEANGMTVEKTTEHKGVPVNIYRVNRR